MVSVGEKTDALDLRIRIYGTSSYYDNAGGYFESLIALIKENEYRVIMVSEYSPEYIVVCADESGKLTSEFFGDGKLQYNQRLDKVMVIFEKGRRVWEMTR